MHITNFSKMRTLSSVNFSRKSAIRLVDFTQFICKSREVCINFDPYLCDLHDLSARKDNMKALTSPLRITGGIWEMHRGVECLILAFAQRIALLVP